MNLDVQPRSLLKRVLMPLGVTFGGGLLMIATATGANAQETPPDNAVTNLVSTGTTTTTDVVNATTATVDSTINHVPVVNEVATPVTDPVLSAVPEVVTTVNDQVVVPVVREATALPVVEDVVVLPVVDAVVQPVIDVVEATPPVVSEPTTPVAETAPVVSSQPTTSPASVVPTETLVTPAPVVLAEPVVVADKPVQLMQFISSASPDVVSVLVYDTTPVTATSESGEHPGVPHPFSLPLSVNAGGGATSSSSSSSSGGPTPWYDVTDETSGHHAVHVSTVLASSWTIPGGPGSQPGTSPD